MTKKEIMKLADDVIDSKVHIQGTDYDRKRVVTSKVLKKITRLQDKGKTNTYISSKLGISSWAVRYNTDPEFKKDYLAKASGKHTGIDYCTYDNRVTYKRRLLAKNKVFI